jgi:hypothetical protein
VAQRPAIATRQATEAIVAVCAIQLFAASFSVAIDAQLAIAVLAVWTLANWCDLSASSHCANLALLAIDAREMISATDRASHWSRDVIVEWVSVH